MSANPGTILMVEAGKHGSAAGGRNLWLSMSSYKVIQFSVGKYAL